MASETKTVAEMIGEFLRDTAILVLVFYPLDLKPLTRVDRELILAASFVLLTLGIIIRSEAKDVTTYLLEIMAFGIILFVVASLWDRREAARPDSGKHFVYPVRLDAVERALLARLEVNIKRAEPSGDALTEDAPKKATAK